MNTTPIEQCAIGADAEYDVKIAREKGWHTFSIYPNGNLIGTSPEGIADEPVPQYARMLREAAPELLAALEDMTRQVEQIHRFCADRERGCNDSEAECPIAMGEWVEKDEMEQLIRARAAIAKARGEK